MDAENHNLPGEQQELFPGLNISHDPDFLLEKEPDTGEQADIFDYLPGKQDSRSDARYELDRGDYIERQIREKTRHQTEIEDWNQKYRVAD